MRPRKDAAVTLKDPVGATAAVTLNYGKVRFAIFCIPFSHPVSGLQSLLPLCLLLRLQFHARRGAAIRGRL